MQATKREHCENFYFNCLTICKLLFFNKIKVLVLVLAIIEVSNSFFNEQKSSHNVLTRTIAFLKFSPHICLVTNPQNPN